MFSMKFEGGKELEAALAKLAPRLSKSILVGALTEGAEPIRKAMASGAPRDDEAPHIADNMVVSVARTEEQAAVAIGPAKGFAYGVPLELGTVDTAAQPFARPAYDANVDQALKIVGEVAWRELAGQGVSRGTATTNDGVDDLGRTR